MTETEKIRKSIFDMTSLIELKSTLDSKIYPQDVTQKLFFLLQKLDLLNEKYFNNTADIFKMANDAINTALLELSLIGQKVRHANKRKIITKWKKALCSMLYTKYMFEEGGIETRSVFTESKGMYLAFSETEAQLNKLDEGNIHALIRECEIVLQNIPVDKGGQIQTNPPLKRVLSNLAYEWTQARGDRPTCGWSECDNTHLGDFYSFVITLIPILNKICGTLQIDCKRVFHLKKSTIGQYITEVI